MRNKFYHLKQIFICCAVAFFLPNLKAQQSEAPSMLAEYELINDAEVFASGTTNIKHVYRKKAAAPGSSKAGNRAGQGKDIEPPMVIIVEENGCETGCTEHGWGSMGCLLKNKDNMPKNFRLGSDGHFYEAGKNAPITQTAFAKMTPGNKSITDSRQPTFRSRSGATEVESPDWFTICNPPGQNCHDIEILFKNKKNPKTGVSLQNFSNGTVTIRFGDTKNTYCLLPNGTVNKCDWVPTKEEISKF